jgi:hypothetical protein
MPSPPIVAGSFGRIPYSPRICRRSDWLIGEYSMRIRTCPGPGEPGSGNCTSFATSAGLPNEDICMAFISLTHILVRFEEFAAAFSQPADVTTTPAGLNSG